MTQEIFIDWDETASNNTTVTGDGAAIDIDEGCLPGNVNNAMRAIMSAAHLAFGDFPRGTARPAYLTAGKMWLNTTAATAPILTWYDGTDDIQFATINYTANTIALSGVVTGGSGLSDVVSDTTPQLGGNLDVNGNEITSASNADVTINPNGTGTIILGAATVTVEDDITHAGDTNNKIVFGTDTQSFQTGGTARANLSDTGLQVGTGARVTTILDDDTMAADSATALATQQSIKAYVDANGGSWTRGTALATTSGTAWSFTGLPAGVDEIILMPAGVSLSGTDELLVQIGDSGGYEISSYESSARNESIGGANSTTGFLINAGGAAATTYSGVVILTRQDGNVWTLSFDLHGRANTPEYGGGIKTLDDELDRIQLTTTGTDTGDAGSVNIMYRVG